MSMKDSTSLCGNAGLQAVRRHDGFGEEHQANQVIMVHTTAETAEGYLSFSLGEKGPFFLPWLMSCQVQRAAFHICH